MVPGRRTELKTGIQTGMKWGIRLLCLALCLFLVTACSPGSDRSGTAGSAGISDQTLSGAASDDGAAQKIKTDNHFEFPADIGAKSSMKAERRMELCCASEFAVDYYDNGCRLIQISDGSRYLIVPEECEVPEDLSEDVTVLRNRAGRIYLAATAAMDHFCRIGALDSVALSGTKASGWYIDEARQAMESGQIQYAGKYSAPDYELILSEQCDLAVESSMIYHAPEVKEQLEKNGVPVLIDRSSYEQHPLGRSEWIRLYGVLTGCEEEAEKIFLEQWEKYETVLKAAGGSLPSEMEEENSADGSTEENGGKNQTAFFYITSSGGVNVRKSGDYIPRMIEIAGGSYVFDDLGDGESAAAMTTIQMEDFYAAARDADYLIYNSTVDGELTSVSDLVEKNSLLAEFKAVKSGNVYCTGKNMYQETSSSGTMILDLYRMYSGEEQEMEYLYRLEQDR